MIDSSVFSTRLCDAVPQALSAQRMLDFEQCRIDSPISCFVKYVCFRLGFVVLFLINYLLAGRAIGSNGEFFTPCAWFLRGFCWLVDLWLQKS